MSELHGGGGHKEMHWPIDEPTRLAARNFPLHIAARQPAKQDPGKKCHPSAWQNCLRRSDEFSKAPAGVYANTPSQIILEFRQKHYPKSLSHSAHRKILQLSRWSDPFCVIGCRRYPRGLCSQSSSQKASTTGSDHR
jgi:hypothetical protein